MPDSALDRRVVVTGIGVVSSLGRSPQAMVDRWLAGPSTVGPITRFDARSLRVQQACEVREFDPRRDVQNRKLLRLMHGGEDFGYRAAQDAMAVAGLASGGYDVTRLGITLASHKEGFRMEHLREAFALAYRPDGSLDHQRFIADGRDRIPPQIILEALANSGLYYIAHAFGLEGVNQNLLSIGTGGLQAIGAAMQSIQDDEADQMIAGAFDTWVNWMCINHNLFSGLLTTSQEAPQSVHRPFDVRRTGSLPGEGAAMFVLERGDRAHARGATILGEVLGAANATGVPSSKPEACAAAVARCVRAALADAACTPADLDLLHLHGDATAEGDWIEARGLQAALGAEVARIPATTCKPLLGLAGVASGVMETAVTLELLRRGEIPPVPNLEHPDPELRLNFVREPRRAARLRRALVLQRCWPSHCACLIIGAPEAN